MNNDAIWKQRIEDLKDVRLSIDVLLGILRGQPDGGPPTLSPDVMVQIHSIVAMHMQTLERYTRPIPIISPFGIPLEVYKEQLGRYQELGLPFYLITELYKDDDDEG